MKKEKKKLKNETPDRGFWKNLKSTYKYAKSGKKYLILFLITNIIQVIISVIVPIYTAKRLVVLTETLWGKLLFCIIIIFILDIFSILIKYLGKYSYNKFYFDARKNMQLELTKETLKIKQEDLNSNSSGIFIERINSDTDQLTDIFTELIDYITYIIGNLGVLIAVFILNPFIALAYVLFIALSTIVIKYTAKINYESRKEWKKSREKTAGFVSEIVRGAKDIKILDAEDSFLKKADNYMTETNKISYKYQMTRNKNRNFVWGTKELSDLIIGLLFYLLLTTNAISVESVIILYNYHYKLMWTSDWLDQIFTIIKQFNLAANRIFGILEGDEFQKEEFGTTELKNFQGNIEFKDVCFSYEDNIQVLKNMNLKIKANQTVGFVGSSGAGKSTIFNLICALNKPTSGAIYFDGVNVNELSKSSIRGNLSVISQNAYIFNMSIYDNLKVVKSNATKKEIEEVCKLACLDEFINKLPDKYNTIVGEGGVTLSGGQKQRLAIARALLLKTEILLFDEATSALDNETQTQIQKAINNLKGEYTILIVAHRLSTVMDCDKIFVIGEGKVLDQGKHNYLLKNSRTYKKLYKKESDASNEKEQQ